MYNFHYNFIINKYGPRVRLCMTDTDSLLYDIQTEDVYEDMRQHLNMFDTSEYPVTHPCYSIANKKRLGTFKDETHGKPILEFVGLRAKSYSLVVLNDDDDDGDDYEGINVKEKRVAKGVPRVAIKNKLRHANYKECLFSSIVAGGGGGDRTTVENIQKFTSAQIIRSENHRLYTREIVKLSLSPYDDKRYVLDNGVDTLAYGHYLIRQRHLDEDGDDDETMTPPAKRIRRE